LAYGCPRPKEFIRSQLENGDETASARFDSHFKRFGVISETPSKDRAPESD
jgi:hypothetical protein